MKVALITGVTGQDGSYLAEFLLEKGYEVHGIKRRASSLNTQRIDHIYQDPHEENPRFILHYGDLTDSLNIITKIIQMCQPDEIYNLGAMSHVKVSFDIPEYVGQVDALGTLRILEAVRLLGLEKKTRIYQASTSNFMVECPRIRNEKGFYDENSPFILDHHMVLLRFMVFGLSKITVKLTICLLVMVFYLTMNLQGEAETFVTRKITRAVARIALGQKDKFYLGNLDAKRDWEHAKDYVRMMWMILQADEPEDWVIATGETNSKRLCQISF